MAPRGGPRGAVQRWPASLPGSCRLSACQLCDLRRSPARLPTRPGAARRRPVAVPWRLGLSGVTWAPGMLRWSARSRLGAGPRQVGAPPSVPGRRGRSLRALSWRWRRLQGDRGAGRVPPDLGRCPCPGGDGFSGREHGGGGGRRGSRRTEPTIRTGQRLFRSRYALAVLVASPRGGRDQSDLCPRGAWTPAQTVNFK